ncbi:hypothetical protein [Halobacillus sp. H74]|uniref:hypothetical protein n=1 Tax=Halobacillus sp. H74 TaxID=3457436 RepID=UPI003FCDF58A
MKKLLQRLLNAKLHEEPVSEIRIGNIIQLYGGKAYKVTTYEGDENQHPTHHKVYLEPYRSWHPVSLPEVDPYKSRVWDSIQELNEELLQKSERILSIERGKGK